MESLRKSSSSSSASSSHASPSSSVTRPSSTGCARAGKSVIFSSILSVVGLKWSWAPLKFWIFRLNVQKHSAPPSAAKESVVQSSQRKEVRENFHHFNRSGSRNIQLDWKSQFKRLNYWQYRTSGWQRWCWPSSSPSWSASCPWCWSTSSTMTSPSPPSTSLPGW